MLSLMVILIGLYTLANVLFTTDIVRAHIEGIKILPFKRMPIWAKPIFIALLPGYLLGKLIVYHISTPIEPEDNCDNCNRCCSKCYNGEDVSDEEIEDIFEEWMGDDEDASK